MVAQTRLMTAEYFDEYTRLPENRERLLEYIAGEIVEVVSNPLSSKIAARVVTYLGIYLLQHDIGHVTGADGGYSVSGERYIPDAAFISYRKQPVLAYEEGYLPQAPDLAVEVLSPGNDEEQMAVKIANYLAAGTVVWRIKPLAQQVAVFAPGKPVKDLFAPQPEEQADGG